MFFKRKERAKKAKEKAEQINSELIPIQDLMVELENGNIARWELNNVRVDFKIEGGKITCKRSDKVNGIFVFQNIEYTDPGYLLKKCFDPVFAGCTFNIIKCTQTIEESTSTPSIEEP